MNDGALIDGVVRVNHLRGGEAKQGVDGNEHDANGVGMNGASPLKVMVCSDKKRRSDVSFPEGGEWSIIRLMN